MKNYKGVFDAISREIERVVIGQQDVIEQVLVAILCDANALLEGYPGLAKTLTIRTLSDVMNLKFSRIQHTPDLMPSDITGTYIIEEISGKRNFKFQPGPVFANIVLADEINRSTPKTQSALLEAMQEKQVTVGNNTFKLDLPFFVLATQNPIEQEGSLALDQEVFLNGEFMDGYSLLKKAKSEKYRVHKTPNSETNMHLYKLPKSDYTLSMDYEGRIIKSRCEWLYTLDYKGKNIALQTDGGRRIIVTGNHPFVVEEHGFLKWKKAEELSTEDVLVCPKFSVVHKWLKEGREEFADNFKHEETKESLKFISPLLSQSGQCLLISELVTYDDLIMEKVNLSESEPFSGKVFGLVVPGLQNYVAGFGGCGINHNTYPLPEAQADRFLLKIKVGYPSLDQEMIIADRYSSSIRENKMKTILNKNHLLSLQALTRQVPIANDIKSRAIKIIAATRTNKDVIQYGASPRASIGILLASKARALIKGRNHVSSEDIDEIAYPILRHRIILNFEAERKGMTTDDAIKHILDKVK